MTTLAEKVVKAVGFMVMAAVVLMVVALAMLGACAPAPARAAIAPEEHVVSVNDRICAWDQDAIGCGVATILPFVGPVVMSCAIAKAPVQGVQGEVNIGLSCMLF